MEANILNIFLNKTQSHVQYDLETWVYRIFKLSNVLDICETYSHGEPSPIVGHDLLFPTKCILDESLPGRWGFLGVWFGGWGW